MAKKKLTADLRRGAAVLLAALTVTSSLSACSSANTSSDTAGSAFEKASDTALEDTASSDAVSSFEDTASSDTGSSSSGTTTSLADNPTSDLSLLSNDSTDSQNTSSSEASSAPSRPTVKDQSFTMKYYDSDINGSYTGEVDSDSLPDGKGVWTGEYVVLTGADQTPQKDKNGKTRTIIVTYDGMWSNGIKNGEGKVIEKDKEDYDLDDPEAGLTFAKETVYEGIYLNNELEGKYTITETMYSNIVYMFKTEARDGYIVEIPDGELVTTYPEPDSEGVVKIVKKGPSWYRTFGECTTIKYYKDNTCTVTDAKGNVKKYSDPSLIPEDVTGNTVSSEEKKHARIAGPGECQECIDASAKAFELVELCETEPSKIFIKGRELQKEIYELMQHDCTTEVTNVKDRTVCFAEYIGLYTGQWKGAGPSGHGKFVGGSVFEGSSTYATTLTYEGDWSGGLPDGQGELTAMVKEDVGDDYFYFQHYEGGMKMGYKDGRGVQSQRTKDMLIKEVRNEIFGEGTFKEGALVGTVAYASYDDNGNLKRYGDAANRNGWKEPSFLGANELELDLDDPFAAADRKKNAQMIAGAALAIVAIAGSVYLADSLSGGGSYQPSSSYQPEDLTSYFAQKKAEQDRFLKESEARKKQENEDYLYWKDKQEENYQYWKSKQD